MNYSPRIQQAMQQAAVWHRGQVRKDLERTPYIVHLVSVMLIVSEFTDDEDLLVAALFHDVLEDVDRDHAEVIKSQYGARVVELVKAVSEDKDPKVKTDAKATWRERKLGYLETMKQDSREALLLSAADKLDNWQGMVRNIERHGAKALEGFNAPIEDRLWFAGEVAKYLRSGLGDHPLVDRLERTLQDVSTLVTSGDGSLLT